MVIQGTRSQVFIGACMVMCLLSQCNTAHASNLSAPMVQHVNVPQTVQRLNMYIGLWFFYLPSHF